MKERKIIDYLIVRDEYEASSDPLYRVMKSQTQLRSAIKTRKKSQIYYERGIELFEFFHKEYKNHEVGKTYPNLDNTGVEEWSIQAENKAICPTENMDYPLRDINVENIKDSFRKQSQARFDMAKEEYKENKDNIKKALKEVKDYSKNNLSCIKELKKNLKMLESNPDPLTNKSVRTTFESQVFALIEKGYVPMGGVAVSFKQSFQAMVKYEDS